MSLIGTLLPAQDAVPCPLAAKAAMTQAWQGRCRGPYLLSMCWRTSRAADRFDMRVDPAWMKRIDDWRRKQDDLPSRAEAIRRLVDLGLKVKGGGK
jgi:hypothetical protein